MTTLTGKRILVTGSGVGIGAATATAIAAAGGAVFLADINQEAAQKVASTIGETGATAHSGRFDLADPASIDAIVASAAEALGGLDGIVNVAADTSPNTLGNDRALLEMDLDVWDRTLRANLTGTALVSKAALPHLIDAGGGSIVNISSGAAFAGEASRLAYAVSKAGINALTRHIATAYGANGVRANAIAPGLVASETVEASMDATFKAGILGVSPIKRLGRPTDIADAVVFLLSDQTTWVTGQVWSVNGGLGFRD